MWPYFQQLAHHRAFIVSEIRLIPVNDQLLKTLQKLYRGFVYRQDYVAISLTGKDAPEFEERIFEDIVLLENCFLNFVIW